jgi:hypothetical protein
MKFLMGNRLNGTWDVLTVKIDGSVRTAKPLKFGNDRVTGFPVEKDQ